MAVGKVTEKENDREIRILAMRRAGQHGVISFLAALFHGEVLQYNDVASCKAYSPDCSFKDHVVYRSTPENRREAYIFNVEDPDLSVVIEKINNDEWGTKIGFSHRIDHVLLLRDPYNCLASRLSLAFRGFPALWEGDPLGVWKQHAREFIGTTSYLPKETLKISFNHWFASEKYRRWICRDLDLPFNDAGAKDAGTVWSSFEEGVTDPQKMDVLGRWKAFLNDPIFLDIFQKDQEAHDLTVEIFGRGMKKIRNEITKRSRRG